MKLWIEDVKYPNVDMDKKFFDKSGMELSERDYKGWMFLEAHGESLIDKYFDDAWEKEIDPNMKKITFKKKYYRSQLQICTNITEMDILGAIHDDFIQQLKEVNNWLIRILSSNWDIVTSLDILNMELARDIAEAIWWKVQEYKLLRYEESEETWSEWVCWVSPRFGHDNCWDCISIGWPTYHKILVKQPIYGWVDK